MRLNAPHDKGESCIARRDRHTGDGAILHGAGDADDANAADGADLGRGDDQIFSACGDGVLIVTKGDCRVVYANPAAEHMFADHRADLVGWEFGEPVDGSEVDLVGGVHAQVAELRVSEVVRNGREAWLIMLRDVSERVRALDIACSDRDQAMSVAEDRAILLREVDHRVRNTFQMLSALIYLRGRTAASDEAKNLLAHLGDRVEAIGRSLTILNRASTSGTVELDSFLHDILVDLSHMRPSVTLRFDLMPATLSVGRAQYVGLVVHELVLNAIKYAYPADAKGEVLITSRVGEAIAIEVADTGVGISAVDANVEKGLGANLNQMLTRMLNGTLSVDAAPAGGTCCTLQLPFDASSR